MRCKNCVTHDVWGYGRMYDSRFLHVRIAGHLMNLPVVIVNTSTGTCIYVQRYTPTPLCNPHVLPSQPTKLCMCTRYVKSGAKMEY